MRYQAVVFDLFGTLIDNLSRRGHETVLAEMAGTIGVDAAAFTKEWVASVRDRMAGRLGTVEENVQAICRRLGVEPPAEGLDGAVAYKLAYTRRTLAPRDGALECLAELRRAGLKTGLVTDCSSEVPRIWRETEIAGLIDAPVFSYTEGLKKLDPRIYHRVCDRLGVGPRECLYVGDGSSFELSGAAQVGMSPVRIRVEYEEHGDTYRLDDESWHGRSVARLTEVPAIALDGATAREAM